MRWKGIVRSYDAADVERLRGTVRVEYSLARAGAEKLWGLLQGGEHIAALGALTGNQAVEMAQAGLKAIYLSGWQVAADANLGGQMYPDQSLYPGQQRSQRGARHQQRADARRPDCPCRRPGLRSTGCCRLWPMPRLDFGGALNAFELMKAMIEAGAAAVHFEDQFPRRRNAGTWAARCWFPRGRPFRS